ncbi:TPA: hypothetical protein O3G77_004591 [Salmonella enterica subsp. enterica serovar Saintpaul str. CFSAN004155]|uniref:cystatin domain-containing protein n=1 Tax=Citrobacter portucalensis TaxID=1639133 RepID=UPI0012854F1D|nr:hypothetical protein [Salmonella enterica]EBV7602505.1 hypothetical protein [Salmonella enterica subsp. enterica serovar Saintpaul]ECM5085936.1 hypothetical protein [Salmonella enterica subsp. enterica serovar Newport]ECT8281305.1 hypothetical protein [Salmonella enterica subsp. enterica]HCZ4653357.1 hypothetical protein [Salmonella enterica subsp. enterica serovar Saintpaul str. CFSAN004157]HCZ4664603.1 hypothetical protein [Salmonella enterica subsp. enterica serovar Saintpaul str. CFSAN0
MKKILLPALVSVFLVACNNPSQEQQCTTLIGGWHVQSQPDTHAEAALASVLARMNNAAKLKQIIEVRVQVVSGTNYDIEFILDNGEIWNTRVYRDLEGRYHIVRKAQRGRLPALLCKNK